MNLDDARVVLDFCYGDGSLGYYVHYETQTDPDGSLQFRVWGDRPDLPKSAWGYLDANWIMGTLTPALEERLGLYVATYWPELDEGATHTVQIRCGSSYNGYGPTFEAAFLAAAAAAVRS